MERQRVNVLDVLFDNVTMAQAVERLTAHVEAGAHGYVVTPNPEIVERCRQNPDLRRAVNKATLVAPDGIGVIYGAKMLKRPLQERVPGFELGYEMIRRCAERGWRLYILGGKPGVAELAAEKLREKYPGLIICGTADGYFTDADQAAKRVEEANADLLLVCLGATKQELWMETYAPKLHVKLMLGLGGSVDGYAGTVKRAPDFWIRLNLEWFYRLCKQPSRFRRMATTIPQFLWMVAGQRRQEKREERRAK